MISRLNINYSLIDMIKLSLKNSYHFQIMQLFVQAGVLKIFKLMMFAFNFDY